MDRQELCASDGFSFSIKNGILQLKVASVCPECDGVGVREGQNCSRCSETGIVQVDRQFVLSKKMYGMEVMNA